MADTAYGVQVTETRVFATQGGSEWWAMFLVAHRNTGRVLTVRQALGGGVMHVQCDSKEDAEWWVENAIQNGITASAMKVARTPVVAA